MVNANLVIFSVGVGDQLMIFYEILGLEEGFEKKKIRKHQYQIKEKD